jgi:hypothetical protein
MERVQNHVNGVSHVFVLSQLTSNRLRSWESVVKNTATSWHFWTILPSITNKMQRYTIFFIAVNAPHVSAGYLCPSSGTQNSKLYTENLVCVQFWILSSWWWAEIPPETCRTLTAIKNYGIALHLVSHTWKNTLTIHGHMNIKFLTPNSTTCMCPSLHIFKLIFWYYQKCCNFWSTTDTALPPPQRSAVKLTP